MSEVTTNLLPVLFLGIMIAITLILLPRLNDDPPRRTEELRLEQLHKGEQHSEAKQPSASNKR
jgi:uncharacterized protein YneF (UPF0154 family)